MTTVTMLAILLLSLLALSTADTTITPNWSNLTFTSKTTPTLQMVLNPLVSRASPIHDTLYRTLRSIRPRYARYQSWFPYPKMAVPEIDPPSGLSQCRSVAVGFNATLSCERSGGVVDRVEFASFGLPTGVCLGFAANTSCTAASSVDVVTKLCVGQSSCVIPASTALFGSPCPDHADSYRLAVQVTCNPPQNNTYWDFTYFDPVVVDFLDAVGPDPSLDLSTTPAWMWQQGSDVHHYPDYAYQVDWGYNTGDQLVDPTCEQVGQYYGRIAAWFTQGGFTDEYGYFHKSPHHYKLSLWEMLNEMEHGLNIQLYTCIYDQAVKYVRQWADPDNLIQFVGLAEEDPTRYDDYRYFLNASNHLPNTPLDWISYHRYALPTDRTNTTAYEQIFTNYDDFFDVVRRIEAIRTEMAPSVRTTVDEAGVILPDDNDGGAVAFPLVYWNACAAGFAYMFAHLSAIGIDVVGSSQLMGYPQLDGVLGGLSPQYPSVSMVNWTTGAGTSRVRILELLMHELPVGSVLVETVQSGGVADVFAQAYIVNGTAHRVLVINKRSTVQQVTVAGASGGIVLTVDERSGEHPPRREKLSSDNITMAPFAVSLIQLSAAESRVKSAAAGRVATE